jgi:hypothetical protein
MDETFQDTFDEIDKHCVGIITDYSAMSLALSDKLKEVPRDTMLPFGYLYILTFERVNNDKARGKALRISEMLNELSKLVTIPARITGLVEKMMKTIDEYETFIDSFQDNYEELNESDS